MVIRLMSTWHYEACLLISSMECKVCEKLVMIMWRMTHILYKLSENLWLSQIILILLHYFNGVLK